MKKTKLFYFIFIFATILTVACKKNEVINQLTLSQNEVALILGNTVSVTVEIGNNGYVVKSEDAAIATASIKNEIITINAVKNGETNVIVTDAKGKKANIKVIVKPSLEIKESNISLEKDNIETVAITIGMGKYTITSSDSKIAIATIEDKEVKIQALTIGKATITITNTETKEKQIINVTVKSASSAGETNESNISLERDNTKNIAITIGTGKYTITNSEDEIATATIEANEVKIQAIKIGETTIIITNTETKEKQIINVTVTFTVKLEKTELTINIGENERVAIIDSENDEFEITVEPADVLKVDKGGTDYNGKYVNALSITPLKYSPKKVKITVKIGHSKDVLNITVNAVDEIILKKTETELTIGKNENIKIIKGNGNYTLEKNDSRFVNAEIKLIKEHLTTPYYVVALEALAAGETVITLTDAAGKTKEITVTTVGAAPELFNIDNDGIVLKNPNVTIKGDIILPNNALVIPSNSKENTPFKDNTEITSVDFSNVTEIGQMALMGCSNLSKVELRNITSIGMGAFFNCTKLLKVYCYMQTPPTVGKSAFNNIPSEAVLYVPVGTKTAYQSMKGADKFSSIEEM